MFVLYLEIVVHSTLSPVRTDGDIAAEVRGGEGIRQRSESMARQDGEEKKCVSGLIVPLMSLQAVTPLCGTAHYPSVRAR